MAGQRGLGKGLNALFGETAEEYEQAIKEAEAGGVRELALTSIFPNENQPRKNFDDEALAELKDSILLHGVINPIVVNKAGDKYMIIAGERRYRASVLAGLDKIPAIIMDISEKKVREIALIENLQREDLNPIEAAKGIKELMERYGMTQEAVSERISKSRSNVANLLRILNLPLEVVVMIENNELSVGHAKCLAGIDSEKEIIRLANLAKNKGMSVRDLEKLVKSLSEPKPQKKIVIQSTELKDLVSRMQVAFGTKVKAVGTEDKGRIVIDYFTRDDLDRISELLEKIKE
ncbi:MAG: ParB/RepB/Spo0J family partition protein [Clostridia bacterium]|nr:ParB/RepB/Spo0J family partition protein [Clostridia bacterium]